MDYKLMEKSCLYGTKVSKYMHIFFFTKANLECVVFIGKKATKMNAVDPMLNNLPCANSIPLHNPPIIQVPVLHHRRKSCNCFVFRMYLLVIAFC